MLTVDFDRLGVVAGDRLLDLGCGFGRHAYAAVRRGARVVALDAGAAEVRQVRATLGAMVEAGELAATAATGAVQGDALWLPFGDASFDRVVASEVLEHLVDDGAAMSELARVLRPGGSMAVTVPRCGPELVNWLLSDAYHLAPGGHVRIYRRSALRRRLRLAGLVPVASHHAHGLHAPYWWLRCLVGPSDDLNRAVSAYRRLLEWDIVRGPRTTRWLDRALSPLIGKSLVVYLAKPVGAGRRRAPVAPAAAPAGARPRTGGRPAVPRVAVR